MDRVVFKVVVDVLLRRKSGDEDVMEAFAGIFWRDVLGGALKVEDVGLAIGVPALGAERVELSVQLHALRGGDRGLILERDYVNDGHGWWWTLGL